MWAKFKDTKETKHIVYSAKVKWQVMCSNFKKLIDIQEIRIN